MPKEIIYDQCAKFDVHVGWSREGEYLQVGIETKDGQSMAKHLQEDYGEESEVGGGEGTDDTHANAGLAGFTGLWGTLDRTGANRLIRTLRKARDEAFGADA